MHFTGIITTYMGRKKKKKSKKEESEGFLASLSQEVIEGIVAVIFIIVAIFLLMAPFAKAGIVGQKVYEALSDWFGIGYYLFPLILIILGASFLRSLKENLATLKIVGGVLFVISGLGLLSIANQTGGAVGELIAKPLVYLFEVWVSIVFLIGLLIISLSITLNTSLSSILGIFSGMFRKKEEEEEDIDIEIDEDQYEDEEEEDYEEEEEEEEEDDDDVEVVAPAKGEESSVEKSSGLIFLSHKAGKHMEFTPPPLSLLQKDSGKPGVGDVKANANIIKRTLKNFGIDIEMDEVTIGPSVTRYALKPAEGVKLSRIVALQNDLSLALAAHPLRIEAPIPGKSLVGIEIPNSTKTIVGLGSLLKDKQFANADKPLITCLGKGISGLSYFSSLAKMPHALIAGATGSGKSVTIHAMITSLLYKNPPEMLKFIMVDPKRVELTLYNGIPHLLTPVITDAKKAILSLKWAAKEMDRRYDVLETKKVRDIESYHKNIYEPAVRKAKEGDDIPEPMPYIVVVIDELADIMQAYPRELEAGIVRLAQMSRAVGIHLLISTQRPSVNVITGLIKANIPARLALQVASQIDSRTILDTPGAEKLLGAGDMLYLSGEMSQPRRIQSAYISEDEVKAVVNWYKKNYDDELIDTNLDLENQPEANPVFDSTGGDEEIDDDLYEEARDIVVEAGKASTSYLQRKLRVGYSRAARLVDLLEEQGVVGPADGSKPREVLVKLEDDGNNEEEGGDFEDDEYSEDSDDDEELR